MGAGGEKGMETKYYPCYCPCCGTKNIDLTKVLKGTGKDGTGFFIQTSCINRHIADIQIHNL